MRLAPITPPGPALTSEQRARYSRHLLLPEIGELGQRRLLGARVLMVGAGGLGAPVLLYLAAAGVGTIGIVDDDVVEASNLQRQVIHNTASVGAAKVDSAAEAIAALNPDVKVVRHRERLTSANVDEVFGGYQLVVDGADNFPTRYLVSDAAARAGIPVVWGSILRFGAQVSVFWSRPVADREVVGVTLRDLFPSPPPPGSTPAARDVGVLGALCGQAGSLMAAEAIKLITGAGDPLFGRVAVFDILQPSVTTLPVRGAVPEAAVTRDAAAAADPALRGYLLPAEEEAGLTLGAAAGQNDPMTNVNSIPQIDVTELAAALKAREEGASGERLIVLDVREPHEVEAAAIPGTLRIPLGEVLAGPRGVAEANDFEGAKLLIHCRSGKRSQAAAEALAGAGFPCSNVTGGILAWADKVDPTLNVS